MGLYIIYVASLFAAYFVRNFIADWIDDTFHRPGDESRKKRPITPPRGAGMRWEDRRSEVFIIPDDLPKGYHLPIRHWSRKEKVALMAVNATCLAWNVGWLAFVLRGEWRSSRVVVATLAVLAALFAFPYVIQLVKFLWYLLVSHAE